MGDSCRPLPESFVDGLGEGCYNFCESPPDEVAV